MLDKYGVAHDTYCYPNSEVLINLLDIQDLDMLNKAETEFTAERYRNYKSSANALSDFTFAHLKRLHYHLFQDLYEWAGQPRNVDISKGETRFCTWTRIEPEANKLFSIIPTLANCSEQEKFIEVVADLFCELNLLHPFREGNGRVLRFFFEEMLCSIGYVVTWPKISQEEWTDANIAGVHLNLKLLRDIFQKAISAN